MSAARRVLERADALAALSEEPGRITRPLATPALAAAVGRVRDWMHEAGLATRTDALGNLLGVRGAPALLLGSHLDSVADAGRYDGVLGVLVALEVAAAVDVPLGVVAFADEEGLRFGGTFLGSRAFLGRLTEADLALADADGVTLAEAIGAAAPPPALAPAGLRAYLEVHIEQGPVLEAAGAPLGVVTAIAGQTRFALAFEGRAAHAGTTPMELRRDALAAAAEHVLAAERAARDGLVATVGELRVPHGAANVVPGRVEASLDVRHQDDAARARAIAALRAESEAIAARRGVRVEWRTVAEQPATPCSPALVGRLADACPGAPRLPSGAGHDAMIMAEAAEIAMLFVRCAGGVSHHPGESVTEADVAAAIEAATRFARTVAGGATGATGDGGRPEGPA